MTNEFIIVTNRKPGQPANPAGQRIQSARQEVENINRDLWEQVYPTFLHGYNIHFVRRMNSHLLLSLPQQTLPPCTPTSGEGTHSAELLRVNSVENKRVFIIIIVM